MSDPLETMDPNLKEVLLDIAKDERSTLFRVEPRDIAVGVMDDVPSLSAGTAGWTPAEKHLLQAYREDVALLLQDAFRAGLEGDEAGSHTFEFADPSQRRGLAGGSHLPKSATRLLESRNISELAPEYSAALGKIDTAPPWGMCTLGDFAQLAYRLVSSEVGLVLVGASYVHQLETDQAVTTLEGHLRHSVRADMRRHSWANLGKAFTLRGEPKRAYEAHTEAIGEGPWAALQAWNCLAAALDCGDSRLIRDSFDYVEGGAAADSVAMAKILEFAKEMRGPDWLPIEGIAALRSMQTRLRPEGRELAHALLD